MSVTPHSLEHPLEPPVERFSLDGLGEPDGPLPSSADGYAAEGDGAEGDGAEGYGAMGAMGGHMRRRMAEQRSALSRMLHGGASPQAGFSPEYHGARAATAAHVTPLTLPA